MRKFFIILSFAIFGGHVFSYSATASTLDDVRTRGYLKCGTGGEVLGMSYVDNKGHFSGMEVQYCRAVAAAIFGDKRKVRFYPLSDKVKFLALQTGQVDVLFRSVTWTLSRDGDLSLEFPDIIWYDGQGFLVNGSLGVKSAKDLSGATICLLAGTTTEKNTAEYFRAKNMSYQLVTYTNNTQIEKALKSGRCDVYTDDQTLLSGIKITMPDPKNWIILPETISKEPLGPVVRQGDSKWADVVRWTVNVLIAGEEFGVTSNNVNQERHSKNQEVLRLLGVKGQLGSYLGLSKDFGYNIIKQVGNYKQIYKRTLGAVGLPRGLNKLWTQGGLLYAPPFR